MRETTKIPLKKSAIYNRSSQWRVLLTLKVKLPFFQAAVGTFPLKVHIGFLVDINAYGWALSWACREKCRLHLVKWWVKIIDIDFE